MVLDMKADPKDTRVDGPSVGNNFDERQDVVTQSDEDAAVAARQFTMAGVVSTKQRRLVDDTVESTEMPSYVSNTPKEQLCLEYIAGFQRQFERMFPKRRPLYLHPPNEKGVPKFVCTTIRPTLLPYRDLYDCHALARFLAGVVEYEPLANPTIPPVCLPSPTFTLKWRSADSFDLATLLVSFLIGAGYDAYVVNGIAPRWLCLLDQSKAPLPVLPVEEELRKAHEHDTMSDPSKAYSGASDSKPVSDVKLVSRTSFTSKYLERQELAERERLEKTRRVLDFNYGENDEDEDPLEGKRAHAWILIRAGKREVSEHFYLEPSTGRNYSLRDSPYTTIESVWNHENYWVNMQQHPVHLTLFDLANPTDWEYVFLSAAERKSSKESDQGAKGVDLSDDLKILSTESDNQHGADTADDDDLILDIPPSWVTNLHIDRATYKKRFVKDCQHVTLYHRAKVEEFADNTHEQGLVARVTVFRDVGCTLPIEIREYFKNRKDRLESRARFPFEGKFEERFAPGRIPEALKSRTEWIGYRRELQFYTSARPDGLVRREEEIQKRVVEYFDGRDDFLIFRSVTLATDKDEVDSKNPYILPGGPAGEISIKKMKEKFARNCALVADEDQRKRAYNVHEGSIRVYYHYATGKITAGSRVYFKAPNVPVEVVMADPNAKKPKLSVLENELRASLQMEKDCYSAVRHSDIETQDILKIRKREEMAIVLETSFFDTNEDEAQAKQKEDAKELEKNAKSEVDYLSPFLQSVHAAGDLSKEDAQTVRDMCLRNLKERLLERANIIQGRLDKENALLAKRQAAFQRSQREHDQGTDEEFERFCSETMFRIQILEQRLASHEETALQKYAEMDKRLHSDPRLRVLHR
ncbi:Dynein regulatory complex subunit 7 [Phytophthora fragariae]|uniref:Dynein regulatory complex subunit 7 n=1 Tax=Phytophthora fragariae TaxID=53985 RepID=A0A6A3UX73_9STRA|nr:Dynein regulatory complex subunit 7 [Phytophthora fragariae]KAE8949725.1 Dynein regulatory complex subunit 7 [Phytophthora fragariae]KAE9030867.1 Dynein regulatory complex subunit 7 [Phytophthora fragariae]KAE9139594.1 Dynein regulatory complex subunit 7 [Phytophthora fragariae]KAE9140563.1 Dynein regulatory complex subunit 7 [Phytophthora fragariae]